MSFETTSTLLDANTLPQLPPHRCFRIKTRRNLGTAWFNTLPKFIVRLHFLTVYYGFQKNTPYKEIQKCLSSLVILGEDQYAILSFYHQTKFENVYLSIL